ncbi:glucan endo-1,3-beta-glucosidase-like [Silene latifolia]|uniref:glucan endo-1,3-beta-glucosidase-like n=1 Tax=Silene latifolia TaxID=37657 RepID=UPI003D7791DB
MSLLSILLPLLLTTVLTTTSATTIIGVNFGRVANNLPTPTETATFLTTQTTFTHLKLFDSDPTILSAFANTNVSLTINIPNSDIVGLTQLSSAQSFVDSSIIPHLPGTVIKYVAVGNEVHFSGDNNLILNTVPAMRNLHQVLQSNSLTKGIKVTTPHSLAILPPLMSPSSGRFHPEYEKTFFTPLLQFHRETKSPFMVNPYPYFGFKPTDLNFALGNKNKGILDRGTKLRYYSMFDYLLDGVYSAMKRLGYEDVEINVGETGWPAAGDANEPFANWDNAVAYNGNLVKRLREGKGTPLMPNKTFETYIFALFNENLKPSTSERNYGLFRPDFSPVYNVGVLKTGQTGGPAASTRPVPVAPSPSTSKGQKWCVAKPDATDVVLQGNLDYVCSKGIDCKPIQDGGSCFQPNTVRGHASYAMNAYYHINGQHDSDCYFDGSGLVTYNNPSYEACDYVA